ncbi:MAG: hypothetical protein FWD57_07755, partial [Polyangiaceae bacterium]|nr:hypothetical protein [Polyangiaceae bacterium]
MPPIYRSKPLLLCAAIAFIALSAIGFLPLFGGLGYEYALVTGLLLPSLAAVAAAFASNVSTTTPIHAFQRAIAGAIVLSAIAFAIGMVHGLRAGVCDVLSGTVIFALGPAIGSVVGACWGFTVAHAVPLSISKRVRPKILMGGAVLGPIITIVISLIRFYTSPMVFAYDPFFGFFS